MIKQHIKFETFMSMDIRMGKIMSIEKIEKSRNLHKMNVYFGDELGTKVVVTNIIGNNLCTEDLLINKTSAFLLNLEPVKMCGVLSEGMIMGSVNDNKFLTLNLNTELDTSGYIVV